MAEKAPRGFRPAGRLEIKYVPIDKVDLWDKNPKILKKKEYERLKAQIMRLGIYKPLVGFEENGRYTVLGGNGRLLVLRELKAIEAAISLVYPKDEAEKLEYALSDNDRASEYDDQALAELVFKSKDSLDPELFRFDVGQTVSIDKLLTQFGPDPEAAQEDDIPEPEPKPETKPGDLYELGPHRVLCGDALQPEAYQRLLEGKPADMVFTDPPYNVNYEGVRYSKIMNDHMNEEAFYKFACEFMARFAENTKPGAAMYICSGYGSYPTFLYAMKSAGIHFSCPIIWVKDYAPLAFSDYKKQHEMILKAKAERHHRTAVPILYGWKEGKHYFAEGQYEADVWMSKRKATTKMAHPTQKPLTLIQRAIRNSSRPGERILDPFAGSGGTIIGAEREKRIALAIELDPIYVDVIIRRYSGMGGPTEKEIRATCKRETPKPKAGKPRRK